MSTVDVPWDGGKEAIWENVESLFEASSATRGKERGGGGFALPPDPVVRGLDLCIVRLGLSQGPGWRTRGRGDTGVHTACLR